ncbi:MAG TPA: 4Fe-4S dicluster domain-containing protein, partial [Methanomassiliicoccales archaeon]|nr:4Fe-4S dicluster domain-containing protein [Methanomassiliicoccales archaeon]
MRKIIKIDEEKCTGCGECVLSCAEGAIIIRDGKAKVVKDMYCDGLGACLGHCP